MQLQYGAADGSSQLGELEFSMNLLQLQPGLPALPLEGEQGRFPGVQFAAGYGPGAAEAAIAVDVSGLHRQALVEIANSGGEQPLLGPQAGARIEAGQQLALAHLIALLHQQLADPRTAANATDRRGQHAHIPVGFEAAEGGHRLRPARLDGNGRGGDQGRALLAADADHQQQQQDPAAEPPGPAGHGPERLFHGAGGSSKSSSSM